MPIFPSAIDRKKKQNPDKLLHNELLFCLSQTELNLKLSIEKEILQCS